MWRVGSFLVYVADEIGQIAVAQHLADGHVLAGVIPVVVEHALHQGTGRDREFAACPGKKSSCVIWCPHTHFLGNVWGLIVNIADKLRQTTVAQHLSNSHVLAGMVPVMVDHALQQ